MAEKATPSWLKEPFVIGVLQLVEDRNKDVEVTKIHCKKALPEGSNHMSYVFRVSIDYKVPATNSSIKTLSLFVKLSLTTGPFLAEFVVMNKLYENEIKIYKEILPKLYNLGLAKFAPNSYSVTPMENSLVLEDLCPGGYAMLSRLEQVDLQHSLSALKALARFHAFTVALYKREPELIESLGEHFLFNHIIDRSAMRNKLLESLSNFVSTLSEIGLDRYAQMVRERADSYYDKAVNLVKPGNKLNVLCHGDFWTTNIMFKHVKGEIADIKLVDFQLAFYSSFAFDIMYFWWSSVSEIVRENHKQELFEAYRTTLNDSLAELQCHETLSKEDFDCEIKRIAPYAIYLMGCFIPICFTEPADSSESSSQEDSESSKLASLLQSNRYKSALPKLLEHGESLGMFD